MSSFRAALAVPALVAAFFTAPSRLLAQVDEHAVHADAAEAEPEDWHAHPNHLLAFMGSTFDAEEDAFTLGLDYTRQVAPRVSVGGFVDYATGSIREFVVGPMAVFFPWKGLYLEAAPAAALEEDEWHFVGRLAGGYEFEFGSLLVGPYVGVDLASGRTSLYLAGIAAGVHF